MVSLQQDGLITNPRFWQPLEQGQEIDVRGAAQVFPAGSAEGGGAA